MTEEANPSFAQSRMEQIRKGRTDHQQRRPISIIHLVLLTTFTSLELAIARSGGGLLSEFGPIGQFSHAATTSVGLTFLTLVTLRPFLAQSMSVGPVTWLMVVLGAQRAGLLFVDTFHDVIKFADAIPYAFTGLYLVFGVLRKTFPFVWRIGFALMAIHCALWMMAFAASVWLGLTISLTTYVLSGTLFTAVAFVLIPWICVAVDRIRPRLDPTWLFWICLMVWTWSQFEAPLLGFLQI